jgi:hypothetical protein
MEGEIGLPGSSSTSRAISHAVRKQDFSFPRRGERGSVVIIENAASANSE